MARSPLFRSLLSMLFQAQFPSKPNQALIGFKQSRRKFILHGSTLIGSTALIQPTMSWALAGGINKQRPSDLDIAVVGAGLAGLSCAYELKKNGIAAQIFEASSRSGGRCYSMGPGFPGPVDFAGQTIERGGELIDTGHKAMIGYAREFGLTLEDVGKQPGEIAYYFDGQHYHESAIVEEFRAFFKQMNNDLRSIGAPTASSHTELDRAFDMMSLAEYLDSRGAGPLLRKVLDVAYNIEFGLETSEQSALNLLLFMHADRRSRFQPFGVFSDERYHVVEGNQAIVTGLENALTYPIEFEHRLIHLSRLSDGRIELTFDCDGISKVTRHDAVVLTLPFSVMRDGQVEFDTNLQLPPWKRYAIENLRYGTNSKMMIAFNGRPWHQHGSNGASYSNLPNHQTTWETQPTLATETHGILTDYSGGLRGATLNPADPQFAAERFLGDLEKIYPGIMSMARRTVDNQWVVHLEHWPSNPFSKGSYVCNHPGYFTTIADNEAKTIDNIYFAGEHTSSFYEWQGFMEGAVLSGKRVAKEIVTASGKQRLL